MPQSKALNLQASLNALTTDATLTITSGTYNQLVTNLVNRIILSTLPGATLPTLGPAGVMNFDTIDQVNGLAPGTIGDLVTPTGASTVVRGFIPHAVVAGNLPISYFTYNYQTRVFAYVGRILVTIPSGTHTLHGFAVDDNAGGSTGWRIFLSTTDATTPTNGGLFMVNQLASTDFVQVSFPVIPLATTGDTQASKKNFFLQETGGTNTMTANIGIALDTANHLVYAGNSTTSTVFYEFNYTSAITTVGLATGITSDLFVFKSGANAIFATALLNINNMKFAVPKSGVLNGLNCIYLSAAATGYHLLVTDLSSGSTTLPNLIQWNKLGTGSDYTAPTYSLSTWSNRLDVELNYSTTGLIMMKRAINNDPNIRIFGKGDVINNEAIGTIVPQEFPGMTVSSIGSAAGLLFAVNSATGQRGVNILDLSTDQYWVSTYSGVVAPSYFISPVINANIGTALAIAMVAEFNRKGLTLVVQYRIANFGVFPGTWTAGPDNGDWSTVGTLQNLTTGVQFRFLGTTLSYTSVNPRQINEAYLVYKDLFFSDDNLEFIFSQSSTSTPAKFGAKVVTAYVTNPNQWNFNGYADDGTNTDLVGLNSTTNMSSFAYSTNGGTSYTTFTTPNPSAANAAGVIVQVTIASPPAQIVRGTMRAS